MADETLIGHVAADDEIGIDTEEADRADLPYQFRPVPGR